MIEQSRKTLPLTDDTLNALHNFADEDYLVALQDHADTMTWKMSQHDFTVERVEPGRYRLLVNDNPVTLSMPPYMLYDYMCGWSAGYLWLKDGTPDD